jgi:hypothetical protein
MKEAELTPKLSDFEYGGDLFRRNVGFIHPITKQYILEDRTVHCQCHENHKIQQLKRIGSVFFVL